MDSRPPGPAGGGDVVASGPVTLVSADGSAFSSFAAWPEGQARARVAVLPDARGLHPYYEALAGQLARAGFAAAAVDYYGRTAGTGARDDDFPYQEHVPRVRPDQVRDDVAATLDHLTAAGDADAPAFTLGFCIGGGYSWRLAASDLDLAGVVGFYGLPLLVRDVVADLRAPMLMLLAGDDAVTPPETFAAFTDELTTRGKPFEAQVYPGAPHSFFDAAYADWADACDDAWRRVVAFVDGYATRQA